MQVVEMPVINFTGTKLKIDQRITEYNEGKPLSEQIRGYHFETLWRIVEHFAYKIKHDNKTLHPNIRRINIEYPERILWTSKLSRENIKNWLRVSSIHTVTNRLKRLAEAGFIKLRKRGNNGKHLTSVISLNKEVVAIDDALNEQVSNHAHMTVKMRSNELKNDVQIMKNRFAENQTVNPKKEQSFTPLLNTSKNSTLNNKLIESGAFFEKSKKGTVSIPNSSANLSQESPKQGNSEKTTKTNAQKYAEKIQSKPKKTRYDVYAHQTDAENLEDYRRSMAEYVFRESLILWKHRKDVYEGEYKKAGSYVSENYFKRCKNIDEVNEAVKMVLWCIKFQKGQRKTAKLEDNKEQFVFYPHRYFSGHGTGSLEGLRRFYVKYKEGHTLGYWERVTRKVKPTKEQKNYAKEIIAIRKYVAGFVSSKRNYKSLVRFEALIKKNHPNKPQYLDQFRKMISGHAIR